MILACRLLIIKQGIVVKFTVAVTSIIYKV